MLTELPLNALLALTLLAACSLAVCAAELKEVPAARAFERRFPEETVLVTYRKADGSVGVHAMGNRHVHGVISLKKESAARRAIEAGGEFVLSYPGENLEEPLRRCFEAPGDLSPEQAGLRTSPATKVKAPLPKDCIVSYECIVREDAVEAGDSAIFQGRIVATHRSEIEARRLYITGHENGKPLLQPFSGARGVPAPRGHEKYPEQIVMIVSSNPEGKPNVMTASWTMRVSEDPPMLAAFIGQSRFTHGRIKSTDQFVCTYPGADMEEEMLFAGTYSGRNVEKFEVMDLATRPASRLKPPLLAEALACFECRVERTIDRGSHTMFIGRVLAAHVSEKKEPRIYNLGAGQDGQRVFEGLPRPETHD